MRQNIVENSKLLRERSGMRSDSLSFASGIVNELSRLLLLSPLENCLNRFRTLFLFSREDIKLMKAYTCHRLSNPPS